MSVRAASSGPRQKLGTQRREGMYLYGAAMTLPFIVLFAIPFYFNGYIVTVLPQFMLDGVLGMSLALMWGQLGLLSFAQATFFMAGGYASGLLLKHASGGYWPYLAVLLAAAVGGVVAFLIGAFFFSGKVRAAYFVIASLAVPVIGGELANNMTSITGGFGGFTAPPMVFPIPGIGSFSMTGLVSGYYIALLVAVACFIVLQFLKVAKFGHVLVAIQEDEDRTEALGYRAAAYKTLAFALSGAIAAFAGAFYLANVANIGPSLGGVTNATLIVIWVAVSGRRSYIRTFIGSILLGLASNYLDGLIPQYWSLVLAIGLLVIVLVEHGNVLAKVPVPDLVRFIALRGHRGLRWKSVCLGDEADPTLALERHEERS